MALAIGSPAPDFELPLKPGEAPLRLADYRGEKPVVLLFFPLAFSSVCTTEMCTVAENLDAWHELDAEVIGISVDSPFVNQKFAEECGAKFPIVSDFNREVSPTYDALYDEILGLKGVTKRAAYVVDRNGKIAYAWVAEDAGLMPDLDAVMAAVRVAD